MNSGSGQSCRTWKETFEGCQKGGDGMRITERAQSIFLDRIKSMLIQNKFNRNGGQRRIEHSCYDFEALLYGGHDKTLRSSTDLGRESGEKGGRWTRNIQNYEIEWYVVMKTEEIEGETRLRRPEQVYFGH
jgi:hypothetical protein